MIFANRWGFVFHVVLLTGGEVPLRERTCTTPAEVAEVVERWRRRYRVDAAEIHDNTRFDRNEVLPDPDAFDYWKDN
jgi:hypothetical protein